ADLPGARQTRSPPMLHLTRRLMHVRFRVLLVILVLTALAPTAVADMGIGPPRRKEISLTFHITYQSQPLPPGAFDVAIVGKPKYGSGHLPPEDLERALRARLSDFDSEEWQPCEWGSGRDGEARLSLSRRLDRDGPSYPDRLRLAVYLPRE